MPGPIPPRCTATSKFRSPCSGLHVGVARLAVAGFIVLGLGLLLQLAEQLVR